MKVKLLVIDIISLIIFDKDRKLSYGWVLDLKKIKIEYLKLTFILIEKLFKYRR